MPATKKSSSQKKETTRKKKKPGRPKKSSVKKTATKKKTTKTTAKKKTEKKKSVPKKTPQKRKSVKKETKEAPSKHEEKIKKEVEDILKGLDDVDDLEDLGMENKKSSEALRERVEEIKEITDKDKKKKDKKNKININMYKKISFVFIVLTFFLLVLVFYFSFSKVSIVITPEKETITDRSSVKIYDAEKKNASDFSSLALPGAIDKITVREEKYYNTTGREVIGSEISGKVSVINNYSRNQPLVATTRLLSPRDELFRIEETINVPAGGEVEVEIYAEDPGPEMAIAPTKFNIPGLWAGLQDDIYAVSKEPFVYQEVIKKYLSQEDMTMATAEIKSALVKQAQREAGLTYKGFDRVLYSLDENSIEINIQEKVGDEKERFFVSAEAEVNIIAFSAADMQRAAKNKLTAVVPANRELLFYTDGRDISYDLSEVDFEEGVAELDTVFKGTMVIDDGKDLIDKSKLLNLKKEQLEKYLRSFHEISDYKIDFRPSFIERVPGIVDRIEIRVQN